MKVFDLELHRHIRDYFVEDKFSSMDNLEITADLFLEDISDDFPNQRPDGPYKIGGMSAYYQDQKRKGMLPSQADVQDVVDQQVKKSGRGSIKDMWGNPWAPNEEKVFINIRKNTIGGARGNMTLQRQLGHDLMIKPLDQGGIGATQTRNTSNATYWLPGELFDIHLKNNKIK